MRSSSEPPLARRWISASRMSMRAWVSRRTYDTSVSSSTHSACFDPQLVDRAAVEVAEVRGVEDACAAVVCVAHARCLLVLNGISDRAATDAVPVQSLTSAQHPAALSVGYGLVGSRWRRRCGSRSGGAARSRCRSCR